MAALKLRRRKKCKGDKADFFSRKSYSEYLKNACGYIISYFIIEMKEARCHSIWMTTRAASCQSGPGAYSSLCPAGYNRQRVKSWGQRFEPRLDSLIESTDNIL